MQPQTIFYQDILPSTDNSFDVGSSSRRWKKGYFSQTVQASNPLVGEHLTTKNYTDATYEPILTAGDAEQYYRGDKTWQDLSKYTISLDNVDNVQQMPLSYLDTDVLMFWNADDRVPSQKAVRTYIDNKAETDPIFTAWDKSTGISITESQVSDLQSYLTSVAFADLTDYPTDTAGVLTNDGEGNLSWETGGGSMVYPDAGIPISTGTGWDTSITNNSEDWNTAYGWGNHAGLYETSGAVSTHAALLSGVHGLAITAGKVLTVQDNVTIIGALGTGAYATIANYSPIASPTFTGTVTLPTAVLGETSFQLDPAISADGKWSGITETGTAGATLTFGQLCYYQASDSRWELAKADVAATSGSLKLGICVLAATNDGSATEMLLYGKVNAAATFPTLGIGLPVYISAATAGAIVTAQPTATDNVIRIIGYGNTGDELFFCPSSDYITHT